MNNSVARLKKKQVNKSYKKARGRYQYLSEAEKEKNGNMDANDIKIVLKIKTKCWLTIVTILINTTYLYIQHHEIFCVSHIVLFFVFFAATTYFLWLT